MFPFQQYLLVFILILSTGIPTSYAVQIISGGDVFDSSEQYHEFRLQKRLFGRMPQMIKHATFQHVSGSSLGLIWNKGVHVSDVNKALARFPGSGRLEVVKKALDKHEEAK